MIKEPDQAQGFRKNAERGVVVSILRQLIVRAVRVLAEEDTVRQLHIFPLPAAAVAGLTGRPCVKIAGL